MEMATSSMAFGERRRRRSPWASQALGYQLERVAALYNQEAMVLADAGGNLWAASVVGSEATEMALSTHGLERLTDGEGMLWIQRQGRPMRLKRLSVVNTTLFLVTRGPRHNTRSALTHAETGISRILNNLN